MLYCRTVNQYTSYDVLLDCWGNLWHPFSMKRKVSKMLYLPGTPNLTLHTAWAELGAVRQPCRSPDVLESALCLITLECRQLTVYCLIGLTLTAWPSFIIRRHRQPPCRACALFMSHVNPLIQTSKIDLPNALCLFPCVLDLVLRQSCSQNTSKDLKGLNNVWFNIIVNYQHELQP